jgi:hypothetical protein
LRKRIHSMTTATSASVERRIAISKYGLHDVGGIR